MQLIQILSLWISGFLSVTYGKSASCLADYEGQCPYSYLVEGEQCVFISETKESYYKAEKTCERMGRFGRLLDVEDLEERSIRGCLKSIHPHHKYKMIWLEGRYSCTLYDIAKKKSRDPGCHNKRYFACIMDTQPEITTEAEVTTAPADTTEPLWIDDTSSYNSDSTYITMELADTDTTESTTVGRPLPFDESTESSISQLSGSSSSSSSSISSSSSSSNNKSSDANVSTYILTLSEKTSAVPPGDPNVKDMYTSTHQGLPTSAERTQNSGRDVSEDASPTPTSKESTSYNMPDNKPVFSTQCQLPTDPAVCPADWLPMSDNLCVSINWNERVNKSEAEESCMKQGGEILKAEYVDQNIGNCLRETMARDYPNTRIFRLAGENCLAYNLPGEELSTCDPGSYFAYICAIQEGNTGSNTMDAAPIAGITLGVTGVAILVFHTLKLRH